jgi:sulfur carrier protein ThiS
MITPLGICITSMQSKYGQFTTVTLNGKKVQLLNAKKLTILDAIVAAGIEHTQIFPRKGKTLMFKLNGERLRIKGENSFPASILLNGTVATINDRVEEQDVIEVKTAIIGKDAQVFIAQYVKDISEVCIDGIKLMIPVIMVNGDFVPQNYQIKENDDIKLIYPTNLGELLDTLLIDYKDKIVMVNFNQEDLNYKIQDKDSILINHTTVSLESSDDAQNSNEGLLNTDSKIAVSDRVKQDKLFITVNNEVVILPAKDSPYMLASIFDYIAFDLTKPQGTIQLYKNGIPAALTDNLQDRDMLEIYWKK